MAGAGKFDPTSFVPRLVYGQYLQDLLRQAVQGNPNLSVLREDILGVEKTPDGFKLSARSGVTHAAKNVVLALGNFPPGENAPGAKTENPYAPEVWQRLAEPGDVLIVGTGLTSLDLVATLARIKTHGVIHMLSRRGLLPRIHVMALKYPAFFDAANLPKTALQLLCTVRAEVRKAAKKNVPWQSVVDALRPLNQKIWENLGAFEQKKFLRFLRPYWDVHRHRCAPEIMAVHDKLEAAGQLKLHRGYILLQTSNADGTEITWRPYGKLVSQTLKVKHVVNCTGPQADIRKLDDALIQNLLKQDLIAPDVLCIGIATAADYSVLNKAGEKVLGLYALGSLLRGRLYESVAVPELREQAAKLVQRLAAEV